MAENFFNNIFYFILQVYQKADLNRLLMSESVGAFCHIKQDVSSYSASEGAQVSLVMEEYERERKLIID